VILHAYVKEEFVTKTTSAPDFLRVQFPNVCTWPSTPCIAPAPSPHTQNNLLYPPAAPVGLSMAPDCLHALVFNAALGSSIHHALAGKLVLTRLVVLIRQGLRGGVRASTLD